MDTCTLSSPGAGLSSAVRRGPGAKYARAAQWSSGMGYRTVTFIPRTKDLYRRAYEARAVLHALGAGLNQCGELADAVFGGVGQEAFQVGQVVSTGLSSEA